MKSFRIPADVQEQLDAWRDMQPAPPSETEVIISGLKLFLDTYGAPPRREVEPAKRGRPPKAKK